MVKCGRGPKTPTRRELRERWRAEAAAQLAAAPPQERVPLKELQANFGQSTNGVQRQLQPGYIAPKPRKRGGRRNPILIQDLRSPSKAKKIKDEVQAKRARRTPPGSPTSLRLSIRRYVGIFACMSRLVCDHIAAPPNTKSRSIYSTKSDVGLV